ncbi:MAG TPA: hypothetical protein P5188_12480 [Flavobacterium sp.]|jgi:hypothetical protein|nr:hypothetical protein [Flavobacterium sp.]
MNKVNLGLFLVFNFMFFGCCNQKEYTFNQIKNLKSTHIIKDSLIISEIEKLIDSRKLDVGKNELIVIKLYKQDKLKQIYNFEITKSFFTIEQRRFKEKKSTQNDFKGYLYNNDMVILLYGDVEEFFEVKKNSKPKNIFYVKKNRFEKEQIVIIYDPRIFKYEIRKGKLIFITEW